MVVSVVFACGQCSQLPAQNGGGPPADSVAYELSFEDFEWDASAELIPLTGAKSVAQAPSVAEALRIVRSRVSKDPTNLANRTMLGELMLRRAKEEDDLASYSASAAELRSVIVSAPDYQPAQLALAETLLAMHEFNQALKIAQKIDRGGQVGPVVLAILFDAQLELGRYKSASSTLNRLKAAEWSAPVMARAARLEELRGDFEAAIALIAQAIRQGDASGFLDPANLAWYQWRKGQLQLKAGLTKQAMGTFLVALDAVPDDEAALVGLAHAQFANEQLDTAIGTLRRAAKSEAPPVLALLGDALMIRGDVEEAKQLWSRTEEIMREEAKLAKVPHAREVALFYADHHRNLEEALVLAELDLAQRQDSYAMDALAWVLQKNGKVEEAQAAVSKALSANSKDMQIRFHAAVIAEAKGDLESARRHMRTILETTPRFSITHFIQFQQLRQRLAPAS